MSIGNETHNDEKGSAEEERANHTSLNDGKCIE